MIVVFIFCSRWEQVAGSFKAPVPPQNYTVSLYYWVGWDSSVSMGTHYGLDGPRIECRWGARFSAPIQTVPGAHPAYYTVGTGSFPGGHGTDHPLSSSAKVKESVKLYLYSPSGPLWPVLGWTVPLPYLCIIDFMISVSVRSSRWPIVCASDLLYCVASQHSSYLVWGNKAETSNTSPWQTSPSVYILSHFMWTV